MRIILTKEEREQRREWGRIGGKKSGALLLKKHGKAYFKRISKLGKKALAAKRQEIKLNALQEKKVGE